LANIFISGIGNVQNSGGKFTIEEPVNYKSRQMFQISHFSNSSGEVKNTEFFPVDQHRELYLVEYPHLTNQNLSKELANNCNM